MSSVYRLLLGSAGVTACRAFSGGVMSRAHTNAASTAVVAPTVTSKLGFSFTPGGLLFPYHLGVAKCLEREGFLAPDTPLAGASAG